VAWNGVEVLEALERQPYDVVLMDVQMPELDGLDATRRICERRAPGARPYIVAMTANAMREDRDACFAAAWTTTSPSRSAPTSWQTRFAAPARSLRLVPRRISVVRCA
jgi:CheY-like chemotaxis protein